MRSLLVLCISLLLLIGCDSKPQKQPDGQAGIPPLTQKPQTEPQSPMQTEPTTKQPQMMSPHSISATKTERKVVVPDIVKGKWASVLLEVKDKQTSKAQNISANLNTEVTVPNTELKIKVGEFLPAFTMSDVITSSSNELKNPAVHITVFEKGKEIFKGWIYQNFPEIHAFEHEKYSIVLKDATPKK